MPFFHLYLFSQSYPELHNCWHLFQEHFDVSHHLVFLSVAVPLSLIAGEYVSFASQGNKADFHLKNQLAET